LATTYSKLGDTQKAEPLFRQALEILETHYGPTHIETTTVLRQYGDHLIKTNHLGKAHDYLTKAYTILSTNHHPDVCLSMVTLATLYDQKAKTGIESTENKHKATLALTEALNCALKSFPEKSMHIQHIQELIKQNQALQ
ncbi:MAG: tetratricopeptide repeat protein, partial [Alphaproteobacteria bacterium]|nr:tetratricopeptide repeat protein [Alphaproteobacteria bacterium]